MKIGVAQEIKPDEYRVALTPAGARELVLRGHDVIVEAGAGEGSAFPDGSYEAVDARIGSVDEVWDEAELLLKVKEPIASEYPRLREGLVLFTYLHLAADEPLTRALVDSGITAVAYETVETDNRARPLLADVAIDQGGCAETSRPTTHSEPVYVVDGVTHYCVANMPGAVPITSTKALTNVTLPYVEAIAELGLAEAVTRDRSLARGVNALNGRVTYEAVAEA